METAQNSSDSSLLEALANTLFVVTDRKDREAIRYLFTLEVSHFVYAYLRLTQCLESTFESLN